MYRQMMRLLFHRFFNLQSRTNSARTFFFSSMIIVDYTEYVLKCIKRKSSQ